MFLVLALISIFLLTIASLWIRIKIKFSYFSSRGVPGPTPKYPYGNSKDAYQGKRNVVYDIDDVYRDFKGKAPFVGFFMMLAPYFLVLDPELVKKVLIKNFRNFRNNEFSTTTGIEKDPLMGRNPFMAIDDEWKQLRSQTAPAMTASKLKAIYPLVIDAARVMINFIKNETTADARKAFDARDITSRYTCDVISSCALGLDAKSFLSKDPEILKLCENIMEGITDCVLSNSGKKMVPAEHENDFIRIVTEAIAYRTKAKIVREDFLAHIIATKLKKGQHAIEAAAHGWTFFLDSYETTGVVAVHALYELASNKRVQDKLRSEILENLDQDGNLAYEKLVELSYLDQVFYEVLRVHPPFMTPTKFCTDDIELDMVKGHKFMMKKGATVMIPIHSIHRDPEYYPDPFQFNPERFDPEHGGVKAFRDRGVLLPFGDGSRICLGMKFGTLTVKSLLVEILKKLEISVNEKTPRDLTIGATEFLNIPNAKIMLDFRPM